MKISVCLGVRNVEGYIEEALISIFTQSLQPYEIIVVDDSSIDNTANILKSLHKRIKLSQTCDCLGSAGARNRAASFATGDYIKFFDGDDLLVYTALQSLALVVEETDADFVCGKGIKYMLYKPDHVHRIWKENPEFHYGDTEEHDPPHVDFWDQEKLLDAITQRNLFWFGSTLIKRGVFEALGGFDSKLRSAEDWDLWIRLAKAKKRFAKCNDLIYIMRGHSGAKTIENEAFCKSQSELVRERYA